MDELLVTVAEAKEYIRVDGDGEDTLISSLILLAQQYVNNVVVRHINLGSIRHFKLVENNIKQFTQHINLCFFCALF